MKSVLIWLIWFLVFTVSSNAGTTDIHIGWDGSRFNPPDGRYKIGLALSGGGARGLAQVGVLKALENSEFQIGAIAGTSIGGIIGGLYAAGYSADSIRAIIEEINFSELFSNRPRRTTMFLTQRPEKERSLISIRFDGFKPHIPRALTAGQKLSDLLSSLTLRANYTSGGNFLKLKYPFNSITTDIITGQQVNLSSGNLADAIRSTMAFPLAFTGVENGDMILMDGGIMNPIPVDAVPDCNNDLDMILAVNTTSDLLSKDAIRDPIDIANQVTSIMQLDKIRAGLEMANAVITPDIAGYYSNDFKYAQELIALGYEAGKKKIAEIEDNLDKYLRTDSIYVASIEFSALPSNFSTADFPYKTGMVIEKRMLRGVASRLYIEKGLFSILIKAVAQDSAAMGYPAYNLEIEAVAMPEIDRLKFFITGNNIFDDTIIISHLKECWKSESSVGLMNFSDVLCQLYESRGFDLAYIRHIGYDQDSGLMSIDIDEAIIEKIEIFGNQRTKNWLIKSSFPPDEGEPFSSRDASRGIAHIYGTDLFNRVTMNILPDTGGAVVKIAVEEKKYTQVRLGWHWHDEYRSEQFIEILDDNLFGTGQEMLSHAQYAPRRQKYELSLKADRFFSTYLTYQIKGYYRFLRRNVYGRDGNVLGDIREDSRGISFTLGQQIFRFGTVSGEIRWEDIESKYAPSGDYDKIKLRTATLRSHVETIDRYPFPTEGKIHLFYIEFASEILGGVTQYTKGFSSVESYFPLSSRINLHPRLSIGWTETDNNIPVSEKFYLGGRYSFRGFKTDELVGDKMILGNLDLRFRLPYRFYLSGHYDVGEVYRSADQIKLRNLRHGYGISIAYDSPLGPIDFCYGKANENSGRWYLNIGLNF